MPASANDFWTKVGRSTATTLSAPGYTTGATSINVASTTNWPTDTGVIFAIDEIDANGDRVAGSFNSYEGVVTSATQISSVDHLSGDSDRDYSAGATTRVYILVDKDRDNRMVDGLLVEHKQTGAHEDITADSIVVTGNVTAANFIQSGGASADGWTVGLPAVSTVTANGNRSYTIAFASTVASTLSEGMRLRTTRTVASTQNAFSLDGANDYYNDTTVSGMTFTDDFSVSAWVYLTAYQAGQIVSRYNGTSGWFVNVEADGRIKIVGRNAGAANTSEAITYQSIPLNKWVHIAAQLDMSTYTATTTTTYIMIDGVNVPVALSRGGTNPTSLLQAGNLEIGSVNGGSSPFPGYIDQVAIYSAKVTQATHLAAMHQGLTGSETSLISAYANGSTTDLSANANNLTAQGGATTVASAPWGNRGASTTLDYGLVMAVSGTDVTVQVPEGCTIPTSGGVSAVAYSTQANPYGWVGDKGRWSVGLLVLNATATSGTSISTIYNPGGLNINIPAGGWRLDAQLEITVTSNANPYSITSAISTSPSAHTQSLIKFSVRSQVNQANTSNIHYISVARSGDISVTTATPHYILLVNGSAFSAMTIGGFVSTTIPESSHLTAIPSSL